jgi:hypothetical protein
MGGPENFSAIFFLCLQTKLGYDSSSCQGAGSE